MKTAAAPGWGSTYFTATPAGDLELDPAEQFAVQQTLARYAFALDNHDLVALEGLLTKDARWRFTIAGEIDLGPFTGRAAILDFVREAMDAQTDQRRHNLVNIVVHSADADSAVVRAYLMLTSNAGGNLNVITSGFYVFRLQRARSEWRIAELFLGMDNAE